MESTSVAIVGAGQAGLSLSAYLTRERVPHAIFERHRVGHAWREQRWDSFCLVTPNWQCTLPGFPYRGDDPDGFMRKDEIVRYVEDFAASFGAPVREGTEVRRVARDSGGGFVLDTARGSVRAQSVVVAAGGYHEPVVPRFASEFPAHVAQLHSADYKRPEALPEGDVLIVGTGQSGCQIAEDLHLAGRRVHLCVGSAPRTARRYRGKDVVAWLAEIGHYDLSVDEHPLGKGVRDNANHYVTGRDGGHDIDLRQFAREGMALYGRLTGIRDGVLQLGDDLEANLDRADRVADDIKTTIDQYIAREGLDAPQEARYVPVWRPSGHRETLDLAQAGIGCVVWCIGYRTNFRWIELPVFDAAGKPVHDRGVTNEPGLYFLGLPWLYTWGSARFCGIARDAEYVARRIAADAASVANAPVRS
jgi:putative flavoprotein involved in K+ transport